MEKVAKELLRLAKMLQGSFSFEVVGTGGTSFVEKDIAKIVSGFDAEVDFLPDSALISSDDKNVLKKLVRVLNQEGYVSFTKIKTGSEKTAGWWGEGPLDGDGPSDLAWVVEDADSPEAAAAAVKKELTSTGFDQYGDKYGAMGVWDVVMTHGPADYQKAFAKLKGFVAKAADVVMDHEDFQDRTSLSYLKSYMKGKPTGRLYKETLIDKIQYKSEDYKPSPKRRGPRKPRMAGYDKEFTKFNLSIHQLLNTANQRVMVDYAKDLEDAVEDKGLKWKAKQIRQFVLQLREQSKKLEKILKDFEKTMDVGRRVPM